MIIKPRTRWQVSPKKSHQKLWCNSLNPVQMSDRTLFLEFSEILHMISGAATYFDVKGVIWWVPEHLEALYGFLFPKKLSLGRKWLTWDVELSLTKDVCVSWWRRTSAICAGLSFSVSVLTSACLTSPSLRGKLDLCEILSEQRWEDPRGVGRILFQRPKGVCDSKTSLQSSQLPTLCWFQEAAAESIFLDQESLRPSAKIFCHSNTEAERWA